LKPRDETRGNKTERLEETAMQNWDQREYDLMQVRDEI
jgi:hypothetical protein